MEMTMHSDVRSTDPLAQEFVALVQTSLECIS